MIKLLYQADEIILDWIKKQLPEIQDYGVCAPIGIIDTEKQCLIGAVIFNHYYPEYGNIELTMAATSPRWAQKNIIKHLLSYAFDFLKCHRITTSTRASNKRALKFNKGIGFKYEGTIRRGFGNEDMIIMGLLKEESKF